MNEVQLKPEELAVFGDIAQTISQAQIALASAQGQANGALRAIIRMRGLEGSWNLDQNTGMLRKVEPKPVN